MQRLGILACMFENHSVQMFEASISLMCSNMEQIITDGIVMKKLNQSSQENSKDTVGPSLRAGFTQWDCDEKGGESPSAGMNWGALLETCPKRTNIRSSKHKEIIVKNTDTQRGELWSWSTSKPQTIPLGTCPKTDYIMILLVHQLTRFLAQVKNNDSLLSQTVSH